MKKILAIVMAAVLVLSLAACGGKTDNKSLKTVTLCLDWTPNTNHTGFYVAKAKGYYEEAGLDVKIVQPPEDGASLMCAAGQAQFAIEFQDTLAAAFDQDEAERLNVTAVAAVLQHNTSGIISRKGEGMDRAKGLEGKRYSSWESPIEIAMMQNIVETDGGDWSKVQVIPSTSTDEASALRSNQTDSIWIFYAWAGIAAQQAGLEFDYFNFTDINPVFDYYTPVIIANNDFLQNDPETAKAFLAATAKGYNFAVENPEEAAKILVEGDDTGSLKDSLALVTESQKWISKQYVADALGWGVIDQQRWDGFYAWLYQNGLTTRDLTQTPGFTNDYLS